MIAFIVAHVADVEDHRDFSEILPPVRCVLRLGADVARFVDDRCRAIAGIFDDLALLDENKRGTIVVTVPGNNATRLNHELAEAKFAIGDFRFFLSKIDRAESRVGYPYGLEIDGLTCICHTLVGRAFTGLRTKTRGSYQGRGSDGAEQAFAD